MVEAITSCGPSRAINCGHFSHTYAMYFLIHAALRDHEDLETACEISCCAKLKSLLMATGRTSTGSAGVAAALIICSDPDLACCESVIRHEGKH